MLSHCFSNSALSCARFCRIIETDIFGKGTELDDSEGVQTARKAKELLDKLAEYKPLAKIEELEECNYNMIDNVLNNEKPKEEKQAGRISIKEKLAEKKAVIEQRDKSDKEVPEKGTEKKIREGDISDG